MIDFVLKEMIFEHVNKHATSEVKYHALYGYYHLGLTKTKLGKIYKKDVTTITNWISRYEEKGSVDRKSTVRKPSKFDEEKKKWLLDLYYGNPILYLDEAKQKFELNFGVSISASYICKVLHDNNMSWKTLEVRAMQIRDSEVERFFYELEAIDWGYSNLVFLDEVAMDNRGLLRRKGYGIIGKKLIFRGEYIRRPRLSFLCFLGQTGILDTYKTEGTFTRLKFFECCKEFALGGTCQTYPGKFSVWILDGAKIHCHPSIIRYLRSLGILPIFLPPYTPFFNPIEVIFGIIKGHLKRRFGANSNDMELKINEEFARMKNFSCTKIFKKCGYVLSGKFDPSVAYKQDLSLFDFEESKA